ncbi:hypothetical protein TNCV_3206511 [Trichonephila clavipes]|nr:hypothetical protein TNCV_3206511 [Trichonephila clavipes]
MSRFGGLSEEKPSVFKTRSKLGTHISTQFSGDEGRVDLAQPVNRTLDLWYKKALYTSTQSYSPSYSPDQAPSNFWLYTDLKKILQGKRFGSNEEVIAEVEASFESKDKSFYE